MIANAMPIDKRRVCDCLRCGFAWVKRTAGVPVRCAKCKTPYWNIPKDKLPMGRPKKAVKKKAAKT
jgi:hypothetical protein